MRELGLEEIKSIELEMLIDFTYFCDEREYRYFLGGGTLIGAVRHNGFIPWDDDIDINMPREDYEKALIEYAHPIFKMQSIVNDKRDWMRYARLNNINTELHSNLKEAFKEHIFIDIFPIDGLPKNRFLQICQLCMAQILITFHLSSILKYQISNRYNDRYAGFMNWRKYVRTIVKYILLSTTGKVNPNFWARCLNKVSKLFYIDNSDMVATMVSGPHGLKEIMPSHIYKERVLMSFEGHKFSCPIGYDYYLKRLYGNYMELPPVEKRQSHHNFRAYWKGEVFVE